MAAGIPCVTDLHSKFITHTSTDKGFICFITGIKVMNEDKLAGNRNFRKTLKKELNVRELAPRCIHHGVKFIIPLQILFLSTVSQTASQFS